MSEASNDVNSARSVMDEARKTGEKLEDMTIERHITIMEMLKAHLSLRVADAQKKMMDEQKEQQLAAKFAIPNP